MVGKNIRYLNTNMLLRTELYGDDSGIFTLFIIIINIIYST